MFLIKIAAEGNIQESARPVVFGFGLTGCIRPLRPIRPLLFSSGIGIEKTLGTDPNGANGIWTQNSKSGAPFQVCKYVWKATKRPVVTKHTHTPKHSHTHTHGAMTRQRNSTIWASVSAIRARDRPQNILTCLLRALGYTLAWQMHSRGALSTPGSFIVK